MIESLASFFQPNTERRISKEDRLSGKDMIDRNRLEEGKAKALSTEPGFKEREGFSLRQEQKTMRCSQYIFTLGTMKLRSLPLKYREGVSGLFGGVRQEESQGPIAGGEQEPERSCYTNQKQEGGLKKECRKSGNNPQRARLSLQYGLKEPLSDSLSWWERSQYTMAPCGKGRQFTWTLRSPMSWWVHSCFNTRGSSRKTMILFTARRSTTGLSSSGRETTVLNANCGSLDIRFLPPEATLSRYALCS